MFCWVLSQHRLKNLFWYVDLNLYIVTNDQYWGYSNADIDECVADLTICSQVCDNTNGSFNCLCFDGYMLSEDGRTCGDVNECEAGLHECQQLCVNTVGGFRCECNPGYELNDDNSTCSGK